MSLSSTRFGGNAPGLPGPMPLPSLSLALSRRAAIFGAVASTGALVGSRAHALLPIMGTAGKSDSDATLIAWADALPEIDAALSDIFARAPDNEEDSRINALSCRWSAATDGIERTPAAGPAGLSAKARAVAHLAKMGDMEVATPIAASLAADVLRLSGELA